MSFETKDCAELLVSIYENTKEKEWKRISKKNINGVISREFKHPLAGNVFISEIDDKLVFEPSSAPPVARVFTPDEIEIGRKIIHSYLSGSVYDNKGNLIKENFGNIHLANYDPNFNYDPEHDFVLNNSFFKKNIQCIAAHFNFQFTEDTYGNCNPILSLSQQFPLNDDFPCFQLFDHNDEIEIHGGDLIEIFFPMKIFYCDECFICPDYDVPLEEMSPRVLYNALITCGFKHEKEQCVIAPHCVI